MQKGPAGPWWDPAAVLTVSTLWANTSSPLRARWRAASRSPRKSGVRHSMRMEGLRALRVRTWDGSKGAGGGRGGGGRGLFRRKGRQGRGGQSSRVWKVAGRGRSACHAASPCAHPAGAPPQVFRAPTATTICSTPVVARCVTLPQLPCAPPHQPTVLAKCSAPPSGRSSRSTLVSTT